MFVSIPLRSDFNPLDTSHLLTKSVSIPLRSDFNSLAYLVNVV